MKEILKISFKDIINCNSPGEWNNKVSAVISEASEGALTNVSWINFMRSLSVGSDDIKLPIQEYSKFIKTTDMSNLIIDNGLCKVLIISADITNSVFNGSYIEDCIFYNCTFNFSDLSETEIVRTSFVKCTFIEDCKFSKATLERSKFIDCIIKDADMTNVNIDGSVFDDVTISKSDVDGMSIVNSYLYNTRIKSSSVKNAMIRRSVLIAVTSTNTNYKGSTFVRTKAVESAFNRCIMTDIISVGSTMGNIGDKNHVDIQDIEDIPKTLSYMSSQDEGEDDDGVDEQEDAREV